MEYWWPIATVNGPHLDKIKLEMENNLLHLNPIKCGVVHFEVRGNSAKLYGWLKVSILTWLIQ